MRKLIIILHLVAAPALLAAQTAEQWQQIYGSIGVETGYAVRSCLDQGYIVAGMTSSQGPSDGYLVRTDSVGLQLWTKNYGGPNVDVFRSIELLSDSGFIVAGYTNSFGNGGYDGWILRVDKNGDTLWTFTLGTSNWDFFYDVEVTSDGGYAFAGGTYGAGMGDEDMLFLKLDSLGNLMWLKTYGGMFQEEARSICELPDLSLAACGWTYSMGDTLGDSWILKLDGVNGDTLWATTAHFPNQADKAYGISNSTPFGILYFCGNRETSPGNEDPYFNLWAYNGDSILSSTFGGGDDEYFYDIITRPEGTVAIVGTNYTVGAGAGDMMMFHTEDWASRTYGTAFLDQGYGIDVTHDAGYIMCGSTEGYNSFQANVYLVKTDSVGNYSTVLSVREPQQTSFNSSVFPNPANEQVTITIDSKEVIRDDLTLLLLDISGRIVLPGIQIQHSISPYCAQLVIDISGLENGAYTFVITDRSSNISNGSLVVAH